MDKLYSVRTAVGDCSLADTIASLLFSFRTAKPVSVREVRTNGILMHEIEAVTPAPEKVCRMMRDICPNPDPEIFTTAIDASASARQQCIDWVGVEG